MNRNEIKKLGQELLEALRRSGKPKLSTAVQALGWQPISIGWNQGDVEFVWRGIRLIAPSEQFPSILSNVMEKTADYSIRRDQKSPTSSEIELSSLWRSANWRIASHQSPDHDQIFNY